MWLEDFKKNNHFMVYNKIKPLLAEENSSEVMVELEKEGLNFMGYAHGGLFASMIDCAGGIAARGDGRSYVTQSMHMNFVSNVRSGKIYAQGEVIRRGRSLALVRVKVVDETGKLLADGTVNMFCTGE